MAIEFEVQLLPEGQVRRFHDGPYIGYRLSDGTWSPVYTQLVWCETCSDVRWGERIESLAELDNSIRELDNPESAESKLIAAWFPPTSRWAKAEDTQIRDLKISESIEESRMRYAKRHEWRVMRASPARCLSCGGTELTELPSDEETDVGGLRVRVECVGIATVFYLPSRSRWLGPEGDVLPPDTDNELSERPNKPSQVSKRSWWKIWK